MYNLHKQDQHNQHNLPPEDNQVAEEDNHNNLLLEDNQAAEEVEEAVEQPGTSSVAVSVTPR